jgi:RimJ/RimL family protein N-acetyltransferase
VTTVELRPWSEEDLELLIQLNAPAMTEFLGGPESEEQVPHRHQRYLKDAASPLPRIFKIVLQPPGFSAGNVLYWEKSWRGEPVWECGWGVLPDFQGQGIAGQAMFMLLAKARSERLHRFMHAFPSVANVPSNALCRKLGFVLIEECDFEYPPGQTMRCNDWRLGLW